MDEKDTRILVMPDPESLAEIVPKDFFDKAAQAGGCLVVDVDGTLIDSIPMLCSWLGRRLNCEILPSDVKRYDFSDIHQDALGMLQEHVFPNAAMYRSLPLVCGAKEVIDQIAGYGIPIVILTSRPVNGQLDELVGATVDNIMEHGIPFDLLAFSRDNKGVFVKALGGLGGGVTVVVDDDPDVITAVARLKEARPVILTASYNLELVLDGVFRAGKNPDDPEKWTAVQRIVRQFLKSR
jgi:hypothetical protein